MAFILFSDSLFNTTYNLLHTTDILHEKIRDPSLLFSIILFIIDELVKGSSSQNEIESPGISQ